MTPQQAADFLNRYANVGRDAADLLANKPTARQLDEARKAAYRSVDVALAVICHHHGIDWNSFLVPAENFDYCRSCGARNPPIEGEGTCPNCPTLKGTVVRMAALGDNKFGYNMEPAKPDAEIVDDLLRHW